MSKIIKRSTIAEPATLESLRPAEFPRVARSGGKSRSLEFMKTVQDELGIWHRRFSENRAARRLMRTQQVEKAYTSGYERGFEEGRSREQADRIASIDTLLREAKRKKENAVRAIEERVVELAVNIAERIIGKSLEIEPGLASNIVRDTLSGIIGGEQVALKVSEEDYTEINNRYDQWLGTAGGIREFRIEVDRRLRRGDCVVETEGGIIDAVVRHRIDFLVEELLKR